MGVGTRGFGVNGALSMNVPTAHRCVGSIIEENASLFDVKQSSSIRLTQML